MLEHADRDDPVESLGDVAIVLQPKFDPVGEAGVTGASGRDGELLLGQGHPGHPRAGDAGEIERKTAEAAANIECARPVLRQELRGEMALLGGLRVIERLAGIFKIGAGILPVGIEEEIVKPLVEIVVAGDVAFGVAPMVALVEAAKRQARPVQRLGPGLILEVGEVARAEFQEVVELAFGYDQPPVHVEFAERKRRIEHETPFRRDIEKFGPKQRPGAIPVHLDDSVRSLHFQATPTNQSPQKSLKRRAHPSRSQFDRRGPRPRLCCHCVTLRKVVGRFQVRMWRAGHSAHANP